MTAVVIDASTVLSWCFEDESGPEADELIDLVTAEGAICPVIWPLEVANGLSVAERRGRMKAAASKAFIGMIGRLPIEIDMASLGRAFDETLELARDTRLSVYDAAYVELAIRLDRPLVTGDKALRRAAIRANARTL